MMRKMMLLLCTLVFAFAGCGGDSSAPLVLPDNNEKLDGAYIVVLDSPSMKFYIVLNGKGTMTQVGVPSPLSPPGKYFVSTTDKFTITITNPADGNIVLKGTLTSATSFAFTATQGGAPVGTGTIVKVTDLAECSDTWSGTLAEDGGGATQTLTSVVVDPTGAVTGGTINTGTDANVNERSMFCAGGHMAGFLMTGATANSYQMVMIWGDYTDAGSPKTITSGRFEADGPEVGDLTFTGLP